VPAKRESFHHGLNERCKKPVSMSFYGASTLVGATVMENKSIRSAFSRQHSEQKPPTTLLILFEITTLALLARFSWQRRGNKLLFWGLIAVINMIAAIYFLIFRDVPLRPL
jgi:hypothetical protein